MSARPRPEVFAAYGREVPGQRRACADAQFAGRHRDTKVGGRHGANRKRHLGSGLQRRRDRDRCRCVARAGIQTARPAHRRPVRRALVKAVGVDYCNQDGRRRTGVPATIRSSTAERCASRSPCAHGFSTTSSPVPRRRVSGRRSSWPRGSTPAAYRLPWPPDAVVFEIDQPQVIEFKSGVLAEPGRHCRRRPSNRSHRSPRRLAGSIAGQRI